MQRLLRTLGRIDGKYYKACEDIVGTYKYGNVGIDILSYPKDPFAPAGRLVVSFPKRWYPANFHKDKISANVLAHFLSKKISRLNSRWIKIYPPTNVVLERTNCVIENRVELRFDYHIPSKGRKILGRQAKDMIQNLIKEVENLKYDKLIDDDKKYLLNLLQTVEDEEYVRRQLGKDYIAFIANNSILPREGNSRKPMRNAKPFVSPKDFEVEFDTKYHGKIKGLGIKRGTFTIITGANYHGKSTVMDALAYGHYNHVPGDGREFVLTSEELVFANKENRRIVNSVDISQFVRSVPWNTNMKKFYTLSSSGSTSQAAAISEALENRAGGILIDEDDSAVNMLVKSDELKEVIPNDLEPITPLVEKIKSFVDIGVTPILVVGALGEFLKEADNIILMKNFEPFNGNYILKEINKSEVKRKSIEYPSMRKPKPIVVNNTKTIGKDEIILKGQKRITVDLRGDIHKVIVERGQVYALADAVKYSMKYMNGERTLKKVVDNVMNDINQKGLDVLDGKFKNYSMFTRHQLFYVLSRISNLEMI